MYDALKKPIKSVSQWRHLIGIVNVSWSFCPEWLIYSGKILKCCPVILQLGQVISESIWIDIRFLSFDLTIYYTC